MVVKGVLDNRNIIRQKMDGLSHFDFKAVSRFTQNYIDNGELAGTITLVSCRKKVVHFECKGKMNLETGQAMQEDTIFRLYSMTKPITSVAAMMLFDKGKFSLDTPVSEFLPEFREVEVFLDGTALEYRTIKADRKITIGDLLVHTSGLTYDFKRTTVVDEIYRNAHIGSFNSTYPLDRLIKKIASLPLQFSPGHFWSYGLSTDVLGRIIEVISGQTLREFLKRQVFGPLGMVNTDFYVPEDKQDRFASSYMYSPTGQSRKLIPCDNPKTGKYSKPPIACSGGAGLVSTAGDYLNFASMLLNKGLFNKTQLLKPETVMLMTKNHLPKDWLDSVYAKDGRYLSPSQGFGFGFNVAIGSTFEASSGNPGTFGWAGAAHTFFFVDPHEELIAIFFTQLLPYHAKPEILRQFKRAVYGALHKESAIDNLASKASCNTYCFFKSKIRSLH